MIRAGFILPILLAAAAVRGAETPATRGVQEAKGVEVTEHRGQEIPMDATFVDAQGEAVRLGDLFDGERPVLLTLNYSTCPSLCSMQLNGLIDALKKMDERWTPGKNYTIVTVSIDPNEPPDVMAQRKRQYMDILQRPGAAEGWRFLRGDKENIDLVADAVGFGYKWVPETKEFAHPAATVVVSPDGRVWNYLYGFTYDPQTVRLALVEASEGEVGTRFDRFLIYCMHYDPSRGAYTLAAMGVMRVVGLLAVVALAGMIGLFLWRERHKDKGAGDDTSAASEAEPG